jgi:hypothetical protein
MEKNRMQVKERTLVIPIKDLIFGKMATLEFVGFTNKELFTKEGFAIEFEYEKDLGPNKDKNILTIRIKYYTHEIYTTATLKPDEQREVLDWFYIKKDEIMENDDEIEKKIKEEGLNKLNEIDEI